MGPSPDFQMAGEALDVGTAGIEQADVTLLAPACVLPQVESAGLAGQAGIAGQETQPTRAAQAR